MSFISVTNITGVHTSIVVGVTTPLTPTVVPSNATHGANEIQWSVVSGNASITGTGADAKITATGPGTITLRAVIPFGKLSD